MKETEKRRLIADVYRWLSAANKRKDSAAAKGCMFVLDEIEGYEFACRRKEALEFLESIKQTPDVLKIKGMIYEQIRA